MATSTDAGHDGRVPGGEGEANCRWSNMNKLPRPFRGLSSAVLLAQDRAAQNDTNLSS